MILDVQDAKEEQLHCITNSSQKQFHKNITGKLLKNFLKL